VPKGVEKKKRKKILNTGTSDHEDMREKRETTANNRIQYTYIAENRHLRIARTVAVINYCKGIVIRELHAPSLLLALRKNTKLQHYSHCHLTIARTITIFTRFTT
jgi:hypothetical protein